MFPGFARRLLASKPAFSPFPSSQRYKKVRFAQRHYGRFGDSEPEAQQLLLQGSVENTFLSWSRNAYIIALLSTQLYGAGCEGEALCMSIRYDRFLHEFQRVIA
jgi:hypothetical protein